MGRSYSMYGRRKMYMACWWESQEEGDHWEDKDVGG
jgi:hypothetical protein